MNLQDVLKEGGQGNFLGVLSHVEENICIRSSQNVSHISKMLVNVRIAFFTSLNIVAAMKLHYAAMQPFTQLRKCSMDVLYTYE